ncbi:hypothetical protein ABZ769_32075 [Streptomyces olivoreticuli]
MATLSLMAAGELRAALEAHARGDVPAAISALMSIDADSWQAIEERLRSLGGSLPALLATARGATA